MSSASTQSEKQAPPRLLVIDDEISVQKLVRAMLTRAHYQVVTCSSGNEGLKLLSEDFFDCIITDAVMPVMSGYDFVKAIRRHPRLADMPVLMLTRKRHRQDVKKALEAGVTDYVLKPIDEHLLLDKVELCLKKGAGKRHIFECPISGLEAEAAMEISCRIIMMSESDMIMRVGIPVDNELPFRLKSRLFDEIGINIPLLKVVTCKETDDPTEEETLGYEARFSFIGVPETDLKKIRMWLQRQELARRK